MVHQYKKIRSYFGKQFQSACSNLESEVRSPPSGIHENKIFINCAAKNCSCTSLKAVLFCQHSLLCAQFVNCFNFWFQFSLQVLAYAKESSLSTLVWYIKRDLGFDNKCVTTCSKAACLCVMGEFELGRVRMLYCKSIPVYQTCCVIKHCTIYISH